MNDAMNDLDAYLDSIEESGQHRAALSSISFRKGQDGRNWDIFKFTVTDPENALDGEDYSIWIQDYSHLSPDDFNILPAKEKSQVRSAKKRLKSTLMAVGFSEDEANMIRSNPKSELRKEASGTPCWITVIVSDNNGREFKNITNITLITEENGNPENPPF